MEDYYYAGEDWSRIPFYLKNLWFLGMSLSWREIDANGFIRIDWHRHCINFLIKHSYI